MPEAPTGTVTFLFTDIQGSTSMWERDAKSMQRALARHDEIMRDVVAAHGGRVFKMVGDACYAAFADPHEALEAALAAQKAVFAEPWDPEGPSPRSAGRDSGAGARGGAAFPFR